MSIFFKVGTGGTGKLELSFIWFEYSFYTFLSCYMQEMCPSLQCIHNSTCEHMVQYLTEFQLFLMVQYLTELQTFFVMYDVCC